MRQIHDQPPNVETALQYASRRGWAVLPMHEKKFYTRDGVRIATRDPNIIKQWGWAESFGMACGEPSRTDVFDIDDAEAFAAAGFDLDALTASTLAATTPSGGRHLFLNDAVNDTIIEAMSQFEILRSSVWLRRHRQAWLTGRARARSTVSSVRHATPLQL